MNPAEEPATRAQELGAFMLLIAVVAPLLVGLIVAGYGFAVWMTQLLISGPPGA